MHVIEMSDQPMTWVMTGWQLDHREGSWRSDRAAHPVLVSQAGRVARAEMPRYCQAVREIAADSGAVLVDHEGHWLARFADEDPIAWLDDPDHPNAAGHLEMANHALRTMGLGELTSL